MYRAVTAALSVSLVFGLTACSSMGNIGKMVDDFNKSVGGLAGDGAKKEGDAAKKDAKPAGQTGAQDAAAAKKEEKKDDVGGFGSMVDGVLGGGGMGGGGMQANTTARCCINGAYYTCDSLQAANQCIGEPMNMMGCMDKCGMSDSSCEESCIQKYGPDPSSCQRQVAKDGECNK